MPSLTYIVGKRGTGKSAALTRAIGAGERALVVVETAHDRRHHAAASPAATVVMRPGDGSPVDIPADVDAIALDNVVFAPDDPLLRRALACGAARVLAAVSHPASAWTEGAPAWDLVELSAYGDGLAARSLARLRAGGI